MMKNDLRIEISYKGNSRNIVISSHLADRLFGDNWKPSIVIKTVSTYVVGMISQRLISRGAKFSEFDVFQSADFLQTERDCVEH